MKPFGSETNPGWSDVELHPVLDRFGGLMLGVGLRRGAVDVWFSDLNPVLSPNLYSKIRSLVFGLFTDGY